MGFRETLAGINTALDALGNLPEESHGRETGQVEYKLNEAKLWLGVVPGAIEALTAEDPPNAGAGSGGTPQTPTVTDPPPVATVTETTSGSAPSEPTTTPVAAEEPPRDPRTDISAA